MKRTNILFTHLSIAGVSTRGSDHGKALPDHGIMGSWDHGIMERPCLITPSTAAGHLSSPFCAQKSPFARKSTIVSSVSGAKSWSIPAWKELAHETLMLGPPGFPSGRSRRSWWCPQVLHRWGRTSTPPGWEDKLKNSDWCQAVNRPTHVGVPVAWPEEGSDLSPESGKVRLALSRVICARAQASH